ncbi:dnaJ homolog subfamily C member 12-like [Orbicella faveolata]|uniref:dnaJ homolog subfamily C member 12-like n=1 Tax=Orbicella faveolata TaxID=48498 RepID=UPI0009E42650|nr:dnaJ homolog subfamily C member 12-like [Orbicella faveolata]
MEDFFDVLINKIKKDDFYALLGCDELASTDQINAEFRQKAKLLHPDKNPGDHNTAKLFERLQNARNVLCNEESRKRYDFWRRSGIAVPYEQWVELSGAVHTSLHWAAKPRKELMLDHRKDDPQEEFLDENLKAKRLKLSNDAILSISKSQDRRRWTSKRGTHISKFRRYEI